MTLRQIVSEAEINGDWHSVACAQRIIGLEHIGKGFDGRISSLEMDFARDLSRGQALDWLVGMGWEVKL